jgi:Rrf2 family transcriptional regulator, iron-sulfur cluster assembly transcription factor
MLSQTAGYALRATLFLARSAPGRTVTADTIASALGAPANYLSKTLHALAKTGIVEGVRGPSGGFRLLVSPAELTVARVIEAFDEPAVQPMCIMGGEACDAARPCRAHAQWLAVTEAMRKPLRSTTLADLLVADSVELDRIA